MNKECPKCGEIELQCFAKYLHGNLVWAEYECECGHYEQMSDSRRTEHEEYFKGYNAKYPVRSGL